MSKAVAIEEIPRTAEPGRIARALRLFRHRFAESLKVLTLKDRTIYQKYNFLMYKVMYLRKQVRTFNFPLKFTIDPCNACNLRCAFCPTGVRDTGRRLSKMKFETFKKLMDDCGRYVWEIDFFNWGEPLLNKEIYRMIAHAKSLKITTSVSSNLNFLNDDTAEQLVRSGLDYLIVSLDGASQATVETYQVENNFDLVVRNLKRVVAKKRELGLPTPFVQWRYLVTKHNEHEVEKARMLAAEIGVDHLELAQFRCSMHDELLMDTKQQFKDVKSWLPENQKLSMYQYDEGRRKHLYDQCFRPWKESVIHPNGNVSPCCSVWYEKFDFGNIQESSFRDIWNGETYRQSRRLFTKLPTDAPGHICDTCKNNGAIY